MIGPYRSGSKVEVHADPDGVLRSARQFRRAVAAAIAEGGFAPHVDELHWWAHSIANCGAEICATYWRASRLPSECADYLVRSIGFQVPNLLARNGVRVMSRSPGH